ncbi:MAG: hypothetical protein IKB51_07260 [Clostridia bacterium]|nr:hypothetical protein [Clostridia bacterium]
MEILLTIILFIANILIAFVIWYCFDVVDLSPKDFNLEMPSVNDLEFNFNENVCSKYDTKKYVEEVVSPAKVYFSTVDELNQEQQFENMERIISIVETVIGSAFGLWCIFPDLSFWAALIAIPISILVLYVTNKIYKVRFALPAFVHHVKDINNKLEYEKNKYEISEDKALNSLLIREHFYYINQVKNKIRARKYYRKLLIAVVTIILVLFYPIQEP